MGRRSLARSAASANAWLPGFEPDADSSACASLPLAAAMPPSPPSVVALASAQVAVELLASNDPIVVAPQPVRDVLGNEDIQFESFNNLVDVLSEPDESTPVKSWPVFDHSRYAPPKGEEERIRNNLQAIELAKELLATGAIPDDAQRHQLLSYAGWGGLARLFEEHSKNPWSAHRDHLKSLLTEEEFDSARSTVTDAFYTDAVLVGAMWETLRRMGFQGGSVIEPMAGTGLFLAGMPAALAQVCEVTAIEKDTVSGAVLRAAFAGTDLRAQIQPLERARLPHGFYDVAIGNLAFGDIKVADPRKVGYASFSIHNWAIAKCIDLVRPGGIVAMITSRHTLDSRTDTHRLWFNSQAELLGAVRLPQGAFKRHAGTDVVADILFFRKRERPQHEGRPHWLELDQAPESMVRTDMRPYMTVYGHGQPREVARPMNKYFVGKPGLVLGKLVRVSGQYGATSWLPEFDGTPAQFEEALSHALDAMPQGIYKPRETAQDGEAAAAPMFQRVQAVASVKPGSFLLHSGRIHLSEGETWIDVDDAYTGKTRERMLGMMKLRDAARALIRQQSESQDEAQFRLLQRTLNTIYDGFVSTHGNVHDRANTRIFRTDPEMPLLLSLEVFDEDNERYEKAAIFSRRTVGHREPPATAENAREAMTISLAVHGRIVLPDMARRLGVTPRSVVKQLEEQALAYLDPETGAWTPADEYLSGHIRNKIAAAVAAGARYTRNVAALEAVIPEDLGPGDVEVRLGAPWVPVDVVEQFLRELIEVRPGREVEVSYDANLATWAVKAETWDASHTAVNTTWGTSDRSAVELLEAALNQVPPKITRTDSDGKSYVDKPATLAAREKYEAIRTEFKKWVYEDDERCKRLLRIYNDQFNQTVTRVYDGSHLLLPGMSGVITPYKHQLDAIWRIVTGGSTLLWHVVGAGKTFTMTAACMEMRRLGKAAKPILVTPNHLLAQMAADVVRFYPNANILMASKEDFQGDKRKEFCARIATGDWDMVVMTQSTFERLALKPETQRRFLKDLIAQARMSLALARDSGAKRSIKQSEKIIKNFEAKLEKMADAGAKDDLVYFDDLGVDFIAYDESHACKNLMRISKMPQIAGLSNAASNRAFDLWMKSSAIMEQRGGRQEGLLMSSATPISNTVAEAHVFLKFLIPNTLKEMGLYEFDAWAATFGEAVTGMEVSPDGSGYRLNTRFARFVNVPELMALVRTCADIRTRAMVNLKTPAVRGGKPTTIVCEPSPELKQYTEALVKRAEAIRNGTVKPTEDNMLAVTNCGRKAALDMRLVAPGLAFDPNGKLAAVLRESLRIYNETSAKRGTQVLFCDLSTPSATAFSVYNDLRDRMIQAGVPAKEIAFIHDHETDAAKEKLFRDVRAGNVRIIFGSTQKLGTGTNFQKRLKAVLALDIPWRPADSEQRDGRGLRPGNEWEEIELLRFITRTSFDSYQAQTLEVKARFIEQLTSTAPGVRTIEDVSMGALTYAEIKAIASGNPLVLEKATIDAEVAKLSSLAASFDQERWRLKMRRASIKEALAGIAAHAHGYALDAQTLQEQSRNGWDFTPHYRTDGDKALNAQIGTQVKTCSALADKAKGAAAACTIAGWTLVVEKRYFGTELSLRSLRTGYIHAIDRKGVELRDTAGVIGHLVLSALDELKRLPDMMAQRQVMLEGQLADADVALSTEFEHGERLSQLVKRQREIEAELDLDKDEAGTATAAEAGGSMPTEEQAVEA